MAKANAARTGAVMANQFPASTEPNARSINDNWRVSAWAWPEKGQVTLFNLN
jgi:hypothetical protein